MESNLSRNHMETYYGHVKSPNDAVILFEACRIGSLPRVQRRLSEKERQQIRSGSVFVWDEREAGMRRWTDGKSWSASRVSGSFLTYREMEGRRGGSNYNSPAVGTGVNSPSQQDTMDSQEGYRYKPDGLVKQSFSILTNAGQHLHLISYFSRAHPAAPSLPSPSSDRNLQHIHPAKGMYPDSTLQDGQGTPVVTRSPMVDPPYGHTPGAFPSTTNYLRHPPPQQQQQYGWSPSPHLASPSTFPYNQPSGYFPAVYNSQGGSSPAPYWQTSPYHTPIAAQQQQHQRHEQQQHPGMTPFDRVPPPLRNIGVPPQPPPAPAHSYPQHRSTPQEHVPLHSTFGRHGLQSPQRGPSAAQNPPHLHNTVHQSAYAQDAQSMRVSQDYNASGVSTLHANDPRQSPYGPDCHQPVSVPPPLGRSISGVSVGQTAQAQMAKTIPSINALINHPLPLSSHTATSHNVAGIPPGQDGVADSKASDKLVQKPGYHEDASALRRLDRVFSP